MLLDSPSFSLKGLVDSFRIGVGYPSPAGGLLDSKALLMDESAEL